MNWRKFFPFSLSRRPFWAWQIELTTRCPLRCLMCPREGTSGWQARDMDFNDFARLKPYFSRVEKVVLEGWGESLLHPRLPDAIRLVKSQGAEAGFVTSGYGLNKTLAEELIEAGVDFIGFSLAGVSASVHGAIRVNSSLEEIRENIRCLNALKAKKKIDRPRLHLIYLLLKDNIAEVPELPELACGLGIGDIVLTNLIQMSTSRQALQGVFKYETPPVAEYEALLRAGQVRARELAVNLMVPSLVCQEVAVCAENPLKNVYIDTTGEVSPCVYLYPPLESPFRRFFDGKGHQQQKVSFGNVFRDSFDNIWKAKAYREFREAFLSRREAWAVLDGGLLNLDALGRRSAEPPPDFPTPCATCHKRLGV